MATATLDDVDAQMRSISSALYMLLAQAHEFQGQATQQAMKSEIKRLIRSLNELSQTARRLPTQLPHGILEFIENGRNPDVFTRDLVERVMKLNQKQKGQAQGFAMFRDALAQQIATGIPELKEDVRKVAEATGGHVD